MWRCCALCVTECSPRVDLCGRQRKTPPEVALWVMAQLVIWHHIPDWDTRSDLGIPSTHQPQSVDFSTQPHVPSDILIQPPRRACDTSW